MNNRVVVTGTSVLTALGNDWSSFWLGVQSKRSAVQFISEWQSCVGLNTTLAAPIENYEVPSQFSRKQRRSMGKVAAMSVQVAEAALTEAGLNNEAMVRGGRIGVSFGSSSGSPDAILDFVSALKLESTQGINATSYLRYMSHTAAVNIAIYLGLTGRVIPTSSACTAGSQGIGYAFETIRAGLQDVMIAGGAEELSITQVAAFDTLRASTSLNDAPTTTPRPFDVNRDGLVVGEGAGALVLENFDHAKARGANILGEVVGFATNVDGTHVTAPNAAMQARCLELALADSGLSSDDIGYVCAHGTATVRGDIAETHATHDVLGSKPISSLKSYLGHTLGACGVLEAWATLNMMRQQSFAPTLNLDQVDPACAELDYLMDQPRSMQCDYAMSNNFAFGGINTTLIFGMPDS